MILKTFSAGKLRWYKLRKVVERNPLVDVMYEIFEKYRGHSYKESELSSFAKLDVCFGKDTTNMTD